MNEQGKLIGIFISPEKGLALSKGGIPMEQRREITALAGIGLEGDRYARKVGTWTGIKGKRLLEPVREVSLVASEAIALANLRSIANGGLEFLPEDTRRNLLTSNIDLNQLIGVRFCIGEVLFEGSELCDPCQIPSAYSGKPRFKESFDGIGGLRAEIIQTGFLKVGDSIEVFNRS